MSPVNEAPAAHSKPLEILLVTGGALETAAHRHRLVSEAYRLVRDGRPVLIGFDGGSGDAGKLRVLNALDEAGVNATAIAAGQSPGDGGFAGGIEAVVTENDPRDDFNVRRAAANLMAHADAPSENSVSVVFVRPHSELPTSKHAPTKIAMAGCGVVGGALAELLAAFPEAFKLETVLVRDLEKARPEASAGAHFTSDPDEILGARPDILVDVLSSGTLGLDLTRRALEAGISVASANKQAIADDVDDLHAIAKEAHAGLAYSASVGGGAPLVETVRRAASAGQVSRITAVVNGTVNYILSELALGRDFDAAVAAAQEAGFAEADPSADLSGDDAVAKAKILAFEAFGPKPVSSVDCAPFDSDVRAAIDNDKGVWRQRTAIKDLGESVSVEIGYVKANSPSHPLYELPGEGNAAVIEGDATFQARGRGAGPIPTAHSVLADLFDLR
ncbi:MAG: hypothetical protein AAF850_08310 [Pseudomonadota bacterium]